MFSFSDVSHVKSHRTLSVPWLRGWLYSVGERTPAYRGGRILAEHG